MNAQNIFFDFKFYLMLMTVRGFKRCQQIKVIVIIYLLYCYAMLCLHNDNKESSILNQK